MTCAQSPSTSDRLAKLQSGYETVCGPAKAALERSLTVLRNGYLSAVKRSAGLDEAMIQAEERLIQSGEKPSVDASTPPALVKLRQTFLTEHAKQQATFERATQPATNSYLRELKQLEEKLTKANQIDDARYVTEAKETLLAESTQPTIPSAAGLRVARVTPRTVTKDAEAIVNWVLANGGEVITDLGKIGAESELREMPSRRFKVVGLECDLKSVQQPFPWRSLLGLGELGKLTLVIPQQELSPENATCFDNLGALRGIRLGFTMTEETLKALPVFPQVTDLGSQEMGKLASENAKLIVERFPAVTFVNWRFHQVDGEAEAVASWKSLGQIHTWGHVREVDAMQLAKTKARKMMNHTGSTFDVAGYQYLTQLEALSTGQKAPGELRAIGALINLKELAFHPVYPAEDYDVLKNLKQLRHLGFWGAGDTLSPVIHKLTELVQLEELDCGDCQLTDDDLLKLGSLKGLRILKTLSPQVTDAGAAAFKKLRPKCELVRK